MDGISVEQLIQKNHTNAEPFRSLKAVATLNVESAKSAGQFSMQLAIKAPDSVFIKVEGLLGIDGLKASINSKTFEVYNVIQRYVVQGATNSAAIQKTLEYEITFDELLETLTGLPMAPATGISDVRADDSYYLLIYSTPDKETSIWLDPYAGFAVSRITESRHGKTILEKEYSRFERINGRFLPRYVRIYRPLKKDLLSLFFQTRELDKNIKSGLFVLKYPDDIKIVKMNETP